MNNKTYKATSADQSAVTNESELLDYIERQLDANTEALTCLMAAADHIRDTQAALRLILGKRRVAILQSRVAAEEAAQK